MLQDNGGNNLSVTANGSFTFTAPVDTGTQYAVTVSAQPSNPAQTCSVANGNGTANANVTNITVNCGHNEWTWVAGAQTVNQIGTYGTPGTPELTDALAPLIPQHDAILMANHGVVTFGSSLESAYMKMETVEHFARIALVTHLLGNEQPLGEKEVEKLHEVRHRYNGGRTPVPPRVPVAGDNLQVGDLQSGLQSGLQADNEPKETADSRR